MAREDAQVSSFVSELKKGREHLPTSLKMQICCLLSKSIFKVYNMIINFLSEYLASVLSL